MAKAKTGTTNMEKTEDAPKTERGATAQNEFAPNVIAGKEVAPAPTPEASLPPETPPETPPVVEDEDEDSAEVVEADFLEYVHGVLTTEANKLGYDVIVKKRNVTRGPVMMYHRETLEGKVFGACEEAGVDYMTGDELQEYYAGKNDAE